MAVLFDPQSPVFQAAVAPFLLSFILVGILTLLTGASGRSFAVCGVAIAIITAYWLGFSWPPFPPKAASHKIAYLIVIAAALSFLLTERLPLRKIATAILYIAVIAGVAWIGQSKLERGDVLPVVLVAIAAVVAVFGLSLRPQETVENGVAVLVSGFIIAGIAFLAPSASIAQLALAITAATGGFLVWTWPTVRLSFSQAGIAAMGLPMIWLASQASLFSRANDWALLIAVSIAFAPAIRAALITVPALSNRFTRPIST
ncbi:MAG: hypothetical protein AAGC96_07120, partial [Pseudomonadota bacterium]